MKQHSPIHRYQRNDTTQAAFRRNGDLTPNSLDAESRRVQSVLTTEDPALVYDYRTGRVVLEVLLMSGVEHEEQTPLIRDHNQYSVTSIVGSVSEHAVEKDAIVGWLCFGQDLDETAEGIWRRVQQGHLRRVSVGYDYGQGDYTTITAGETQSVGGRSFTAPKDRDLRVVTRWRLREVSLVVIPADPRAQVRGTSAAGDQESTLEQLAPPDSSHPNTGEDEMKKFLQFLHKHGLAKDVTDTVQALRWAADGNLTSPQITELAELCKADAVEFDAASCVAKRSQASTTNTRAATADDSASEDNSNGGSSTGTRTQIDPTAAAQSAVAAERSRVAAIRALHVEHPEVPETVVRAAENDGLTIDQTRASFLVALRDSRQDGVAPAGHVRGGEQLNLRVLQAALLERNGITPDSEIFRSNLVDSVARRRQFRADWMANVPASGQRRDDFEQAFDIANQRGLRNASLMRIAEAIVGLETNERFYDENEILERAFSSGGFTAVYGSVVHMMLLSSYMGTPATFSAFAEVVDVGDFRANQEAEMGAVGRLKKQGKNGGKAALLNVDDPVLTSVTAERYAGLLKLTDTMIINDTLGVTGMLPAELGETCRQMINDLAWAQVLNTGNLSDGRTRYNATDGNVISVTAFDEAALTALGVNLKAKKVGSRRIQIGEGVLCSGLTHSPTVRKMMTSQEINNARNPHAGTYSTVEDSAIDLGVDDPANDDATIAGTPNAIYAFAGGTKRSITVAFRRGTNRGPVTRSGMLAQGEWGMYWDVYMDVGAAFRRRIGTTKVNITG